MDKKRDALVRVETPRGRPTSLNDTTRAVILAAVRLGAYREVAAQMAGIDPRTFSRWMTSEEEPWASFAEEVRQAEAETEVKAASALLTSGDPRMMLAWLERRHKARWSPRQEATGPDGGPVEAKVDLSQLTEDELQRIINGESVAQRARKRGA